MKLVTDRGLGAKYNASDLNRINDAFVYLRDKMNGKCGFNLDLTIKTDWTRNDLGQIGAQSLMEAYRQNVVKIRAAITQVASTPPAPDSMRFLTYHEANNIERILEAVDDAITRLTAVFIRSAQATAYCGGVMLAIPYEKIRALDSDGKYLFDKDGASLYLSEG